MKRIVTGIVTAGLVVVGVAPVAEARVTEVVPIIKVVVGGPVATYRTPVRTNTTLYDTHYASTWIQYPGGRQLFSGEGRSRAATVPVLGEVQSDFMNNVWGLTDGVAVDDVDGRSTAVVFDVRRRTKVGLTASVLGGSTVLLGARVTHYDAVTGRYINSRLSPVRLQELIGGKWVTVKNVKTDTAGRASGLVVPATAGSHRFRALRPNGATVWSAASLSRVVRVSG